MIKNPLNKTLFPSLLIVLIISVLPLTGQAADPLTINQVDINYTDKTAIISWTTNQNAYGRINYGLEHDKYTWTMASSANKKEQTITLVGLRPDTKYYFKVTSWNNYEEVESFERSFSTEDLIDNQAPTISKVTAAYITGTTATIQWQTDEPASTEVEYGLTDEYGKKKTNSKKVTAHSITLTGLKTETVYHFMVKSQDNQKNIARWYDKTFYTKSDDTAKTKELTISNIKPISNNDINITTNSAIIGWHTNKLAEGWVRYGTKKTRATKIATSPPQSFTQTVALTDLEPDTAYYFEIEVKDVFNKKTESTDHWFITKSIGDDQPPIIIPPTPDLNYTPTVALYKTTTSPEVYAILENGTKNYITSETAFNRYGYHWGDIKTVSQQQLNQYPDTQLVKAPNDPTVYYLFKRPNHQWLKIAIPSEAVFMSYPGNTWEQVVAIDQADIDTYNNAFLIKTKNNPQVYYLDGQQKRHIKTENAFKRYGYQWSDIVELNNTHLNSYTDGPTVE